MKRGRGNYFQEKHRRKNFDHMGSASWRGHGLCFAIYNQANRIPREPCMPRKLFYCFFVFAEIYGAVLPLGNRLFEFLSWQVVAEFLQVGYRFRGDKNETGKG
jgi:hypothetical protein